MTDIALAPKPVVLESGGHNNSRTPNKWCAMEAVAFFAGEPWSDRPNRVSPVIGAFLRRWNDDLDHEGRQRLVPYVVPRCRSCQGPVALYPSPARCPHCGSADGWLPPRVSDTNTGADDEAVRGWMATDWLIRVHLPTWLRLAGLTDHADIVASLPPFTDLASLTAGAPAVKEAAEAAGAAWAAEAAWAALRPTVEELQASAFDLLDRMIAVGREEAA